MSYVFPGRVKATATPANEPDMLVHFEPLPDLTAFELYAAMRIGFDQALSDLLCMAKEVAKVRAAIAEAGAERHFRWELAQPCT